MFINILFYSKNYNSLTKFLTFFYRLCSDDIIRIRIFSKQFQKKVKTKKFTVLQSPHVNKTSQEQFKYILFYKQIDIYSFQNTKLLTIIKKIHDKLFPDVKFRIRFTLNEKRSHERKVFELDPNKFSVNHLEKNLKDIKPEIRTYLKLFDIFGANIFK